MIMVIACLLLRVLKTGWKWYKYSVMVNGTGNLGVITYIFLEFYNMTTYDCKLQMIMADC